MMRKAFAILAFLLLLSGWQTLTPARQAAAQGSDWTPGLYLGWVYFMARSDYDYNLSENGVTVKDTTTLYQESHGTIECNVQDAAGSGACSGKFPMDRIAGRLGALTGPDCNATWKESIRALGVDKLVPLAPLTAVPLSGGFSIPFNPESGPGYANLVVDASGSPTCRSQAISAQTKIGIPKWPDLDFYIETHTALTAGGTCSMKSFPRQLTVGHAVTKAVIEQCQWLMFYYDPYARLP